MSKQAFESAEDYILSRKYNVLNRKARKIQSMVASGWEIIIPSPSLFVLTKTEENIVATVAFTGSMFFPHEERKTENLTR